MKFTHTGATVVPIFLVLSLSWTAVAQTRSGELNKDFICKPLPWARTAVEAVENKARLQDLSACPSEQYPAQPEHPVAEVKCRPLPPAGSTTIAKLYGDRLQDKRICPAGQFPMRYGPGNDLPENESCTPFTGNTFSDWDWKRSGAILDPEIAIGLTMHLSMVQPCPHGQLWRHLDRSPLVPHDIGDPSLLHISSMDSVRPTNNAGTDVSIVSSTPPCTPANTSPSSNSLNNYWYAKVVDSFTASGVYGVSGRFVVEKPDVPDKEQGHSLAQIGAITYAEGSDNDIHVEGSVELGWKVLSFTDHNPRLFAVSSFNNYNDYCRNFGGLGNVIGDGGNCLVINDPDNTIFLPGSTLIDGLAYDFAAIHCTGLISPVFAAPFCGFSPLSGFEVSGWYLYVDSVPIGYYPDGAFSGCFPKALQIVWQGEVNALTSRNPPAVPTTAMGSGKLSTNLREAALVKNLFYYNSNDQNLPATGSNVRAVTQTSIKNFPVPPSAYSIDFFPGIGFTYGGPGAHSQAAYIPNYSSPTTVNLTQVGEAGGLGPSTVLPKTPLGGFYAPGIVAVSPDGATIAVSANNPSSILVFNADPLGGSAPIYSYAVLVPEGVLATAFSPDSSTLWISSFDANGVKEIAPLNLSGQTLGAPTAVGNSSSGGFIASLAASSDGNTLYALATNQVDPASVYVLNVQNAPFVSSTITIGAVPSIGGFSGGLMVLSPDQANLYITGPGTSIYDVNLVPQTQGSAGAAETQANAGPVVSTIDVGSLQQLAIAVTPDSQKVYVLSAADTQFQNGPSAPTVVSVYNLRAAVPVAEAGAGTGASTPSRPGIDRPNALVSQISLPGPAIGIGLAMAADGSVLYAATTCFNVACGNANAQVARIDPSTDTLIDVVPLPGKLTSGVLDSPGHGLVLPTVIGAFAGSR